MTIYQERKLSQKDLSDKSGVNLKSLSRYELGTSIPPADVLKAIADGLDVSADALLSDEQVLIQDKDLLKKLEVIQQMDEETKNRGAQVPRSGCQGFSG